MASIHNLYWGRFPCRGPSLEMKDWLNRPSRFAKLSKKLRNEGQRGKGIPSIVMKEPSSEGPQWYDNAPYDTASCRENFTNSQWKGESTEGGYSPRVGSHPSRSQQVHVRKSEHLETRCAKTACASRLYQLLQLAQTANRAASTVLEP
jgi:hypothetical protein